MTDADITRAIDKDPDTLDDWTDAELVMPVKKRSIHLRIDPDVLASAGPAAVTLLA
jgi:hypothetical protein